MWEWTALKYQHFPVCFAWGVSPNRQRIPEEEVTTEHPQEKGPEQEELVLDGTGVKPCAIHGMDHLTRDPSCEYCKRALGPLCRHLRDKDGTAVKDQTPTLSFDFSGPFPVSATGKICAAFHFGAFPQIRLLWGFALDHRTKENVRACLRDVVSELTVMTGAPKPPVVRCHSDQAGEFLSPVIMEWLKDQSINRLLHLHMTLLRMVWQKGGRTVTCSAPRSSPEALYELF